MGPGPTQKQNNLPFHYCAIKIHFADYLQSICHRLFFFFFFAQCEVFQWSISKTTHTVLFVCFRLFVYEGKRSDVGSEWFLLAAQKHGRCGTVREWRRNRGSDWRREWNYKEEAESAGLELRLTLGRDPLRHTPAPASADSDLLLLSTCILQEFSAKRHRGLSLSTGCFCAQRRSQIKEKVQLFPVWKPKKKKQKKKNGILQTFVSIVIYIK